MDLPIPKTWLPAPLVKKQIPVQLGKRRATFAPQVNCCGLAAINHVRKIVFLPTAEKFVAPVRVRAYFHAPADLLDPAAFVVAGSSAPGSYSLPGGLLD